MFPVPSWWDVKKKQCLDNSDQNDEKIRGCEEDNGDDGDDDDNVNDDNGISLMTVMGMMRK